MLVSITSDLISHLQGRSSCSNPLNLVRSRAHASQNKATVVVRVKLLQTFPTHSRADGTTVSLKDVVQRYPKMPSRRCGNAGNEENQRESAHFWWLFLRMACLLVGFSTTSDPVGLPRTVAVLMTWWMVKHQCPVVGGIIVENAYKVPAKQSVHLRAKQLFIWFSVLRFCVWKIS